jgi:hypothetical protein
LISVYTVETGVFSATAAHLVNLALTSLHFTNMIAYHHHYLIVLIVRCLWTGALFISSIYVVVSKKALPLGTTTGNVSVQYSVMASFASSLMLLILIVETLCYFFRRSNM